MSATNESVIEVALQAACIRAAASSISYQNFTLPDWVHVVDEHARELYVRATAKPWKRGDT